MTRQQLLLVAIAAVSLGYGLTRLPILPEPVKPSLRLTGVSETAGAPTGIPKTVLATVAPSAPVPAEADHGVTAPAPNPEWSTLFEGAPDELPEDLGEPLDADTGDVSESIPFSADRVDIGPTLDADDPLTYERVELSGASNNIGEPMDADDPRVPPIAGEHPVDLGQHIDANDPWGWALSEGESASIEIGVVLDAGSPIRH
jgi:hypothetical protein